MKSDKIALFMQLANQQLGNSVEEAGPELRKLGAQLLLSEVLEYVIKGLGVIPVVEGQEIYQPDALQYHVPESAKPNKLEMLDGLADVAYTMYWNSECFALRLEEAFERVCENNLAKFIHLSNWQKGEGVLAKDEWSLGRGVAWPKEVQEVSVVAIGKEFYAVGKDGRGKVRKPSSYESVDLGDLL